ncbi:Transcriptional regulator, DeoR family [Pseudomonas chlororaphis]|uniref:Transcriptional regulator, DeoR family n=1 Tax=Pseudomonas chlororaphis TaxID=587753 RepID=A0A3G7TH88_9PSED|nr:transcriptional regulator [Pseudomonas chlororaphis]AZE45729.1 Transcriptional regulator, DeoR family [Pseudomonas chlororaphis]
MSYARENFENSAQRSSEQLMRHLKTYGACSTASLSKVLNVTSEAVRQQMAKLVEQGLVDSVVSRSGVGRPKQLWQLTTAGHARFPDTHAQLTVQIIHSVAHLFGQTGINQIIEHRGTQQLAEYQAQLASASSLVERVMRLADARDAEGYMARVESDGDDFLLIEDHCPICAAATKCQGFCASELSQFQMLMQGWGQVTREEHLLHGARRCVYRIRKVAPK